MSPTKALLITLLVLLIIFYIQSYLKPKNEYTIVQAYLDNITLDTLYDKYPIVIYDLVKDPRSLLTSLFAYSYQFDTYAYLEPNKMTLTYSKFTLVYNETSDVLINIISPKYTVDRSKPLSEQDSTLQYVTVNLKKHQILVLPFKWVIECQSDVPCRMILLDDIISGFLKTINLL